LFPASANQIAPLNLPVTATGSTTARTLAAWFADTANVVANGAAMNGTTDDTSAYNRARGLVTNSGIVFVPPGGFNIYSSPTSGPSKGNVLWDLSGNSYGTSTNPVGSIGEDVVRSVIGGGEWLSRTASTILPSPNLRVDLNFNTITSGTPSAATISGIVVNGIAPAPTSSTSYAAAYLWPLVVNLSADSIGQAELVAINASVFRHPFADSYGPRNQAWTLNTFWQDQTGFSSDKAGSMVGYELDMVASNDDNYYNSNNRLSIQIEAWNYSLSSGVPARFNKAILIGVNDNKTFYGTGISFNAPFDNTAIDFTQMTGASFVITTTSAQGAAGVTIPMPYTSGATVGGTVSGTNVPAGATVLSKTPTSITISASTTSTGVPSGTALTFMTNAPAILLSADQTIAFKSDKSRIMRWDATAGFQWLNGSTVLGGLTDSSVFTANTFSASPLSGTDGFIVTGTTGVVGYDCHNATLATSCFRMDAGQTFALTSAADRTITYNSSTQRLYYTVNGTNVFSIDASGNVRAAGTVTGSTTP
jgi:hypothetical protein